MKKNYLIVGLIFLIFFVISFITNILGSIIPDIKESFGLSLTMAGFIPASFFIAYGVMSIPAGIFVEKYGEKKVIIASFMISLIGAIAFVSLPLFSVALMSLFLIGIGMAMLQVAINPLLRVSGGESNFAFFSVMAQLVFGAASAFSPYVYGYLSTNLKIASEDTPGIIGVLKSVVPDNVSWVSLYWLFAIVLLAMVIINMIVKFPKVELQDDEKGGSKDSYFELLKNRYVILFFLAIFAYVGTEQGVANWISEFLKQYHGCDPEVIGAAVVSRFWLYLTLGCFVGLGLLKLLDSKIILIVFSALAMIALLVALIGDRDTAIFAFPMVGFFASVMWSIIFSLALNSIPNHHGSFSGILCTGIAGGAVMPLVVGSLGDVFGLKFGLAFMFITLAYILSIGFWAKPLIKNKTIWNREE